ncbi:MAG: uridine kinase [Clostridiales bacterium]|nr:uridine kinase [Clostridiales bacterium]
MEQAIIIGVAGGSASGKTTVVNRLKEEFLGNVVLLCHDMYYKAHDDMPFEERAQLNYDHPNAFDTDLFIHDILSLKNGTSIERPVYDFSNHNRSKDTVTVHPAKVIIIDGFLIFENPTLRSMMDIKIFVDTDADERIIRRILRDVEERGRSLESVINQYITTVKPMHEEFVEPTKKYADIIVPRGGKNEVAIEMLVERIKAFL